VTKPAKILFDECVGRPIVAQIRSLIGIDPTVQLDHVIDKGFGGQNDDQWIPLIADEGWIIITGDSGKSGKRGRGEKLPVVCAAFGVTYAAFSRSVVHATAFQKHRIIIDLWDALVALKDAPPGSGYSIRPAGRGTHYTLVLAKPAPEKLDALPKVQQRLPGQ
jgi:hypothetical protein